MRLIADDGKGRGRLIAPLHSKSSSPTTGASTQRSTCDGFLRPSVPAILGSRLRSKGWRQTSARHDDWGVRCVLRLQLRKSQCLDRGRYLRQQVPGIQSS